MRVKKAILISISSDIGAALAHHWLSLGWQIYGTYRTPSPTIAEWQATNKIRLFPCDLVDPLSLQRASEQLIQAVGKWDVLVFGAGTLAPVGPFLETDFNEWEKGIRANFLSGMSLLHKLLPFRNDSQQPAVLFFAGSGTNNAAKNYSNYTVSKIALIKMVELLDAEIPDTRFVIVGPGWVKTKIHDQTLQAGKSAGENWERTKQRLSENQFVPMDQVISCCHWLVSQAQSVVGGRNFSVAFDTWNTPELEQALQADPDMYKLRRYKNSWTKER